MRGYSPKDMTVELFIPCYVNRYFPQTGVNTLKILEKLGCQVRFDPQKACCGVPAYEAGYASEAGRLAEVFVKKFDQTVDFLVSPSAYCVDMIRNGYDRLLKAIEPTNYYTLQKRTFELSEFITDVLQVTHIEGASLEGKAVFHDGCKAWHACGVYEAPRILLAQVNGLELVEMRDKEFCCGFGGNLPRQYTGLAAALAQQKIDQCTATQADYLISTELTCLMHLEGYLRKNRKKMKILHLADVLAEGW